MSIYYGGSIITVNDNQPLVDAGVIKREKIDAIGNLQKIKIKLIESLVKNY